MNRRVIAALLAVAVLGAAACGRGSAVTSTTTDRPLHGAGAATLAVVVVACGERREATGVVLREGLAVTNAHVVAGARGAAVTVPDGLELDVEVVAFDGVRDLAVLAPVDADAAWPDPLGTRPAVTGEPATVVGFGSGAAAPGATPVVVADTAVVGIPDIHGQGEHLRQVVVLAGEVTPGDSGAAVVAADGAVVGVVFAASRATPDRAYAVAPAEIDAVLAGAGTAAVDTGACLSGG